MYAFAFVLIPADCFWVWTSCDLRLWESKFCKLQHLCFIFFDKEHLCFMVGRKLCCLDLTCSKAWCSLVILCLMLDLDYGNEIVFGLCECKSGHEETTHQPGISLTSCGVGLIQKRRVSRNPISLRAPSVTGQVGPSLLNLPRSLFRFNQGWSIVISNNSAGPKRRHPSHLALRTYTQLKNSPNDHH
jgi:hypothetical protein